MESILQLAANAGGVVFLATLVVWLQVRQAEKEKSDSAQRLKEERDDKLGLAAVLESNTRVLTELISVINELRQTQRKP